MSALQVSGVTVSFGAHIVLRDIGLRVDDGVTAVLGPSGCGKTTFLRVIAGFLEPEAGSVVLAGQPVAGHGRSVAARHRRIGYVPQEGALFPHLTVAANVSFGLDRAERGRAGTRVADLLDLVELPQHLAGRFPHELSGGQQQRVALARALAPRPRLVLLDEPFSSLDASLREETGRAVVRALRASGAAALMVTHDQGEALSLADQVAVMAQGRFLQVGSPEDVYLSPIDETVAAFLGHAALLPGRATEHDGATTATCVLGTVPLRGEVATGCVMLAVRAEQVHVISHDNAEGTSAEVVDVSFFGHDATIRARVHGTEDVLTARTPAGAIPRPGDKVKLEVVGDVLAFEAGGER